MQRGHATEGRGIANRVQRDQHLVDFVEDVACPDQELAEARSERPPRGERLRFGQFSRADIGSA